MFVVEYLINIIAPHNCLVCTDEGSLLCAWCAPDACPKVPERCYRCFKASSDNEVCKSCKSQTVLRHVWVRSEYMGVTKELIKVLKFGRAQVASQPIANLMHEILPYLDRTTFVTPIPTASSRVRKRGYDQSSLLSNRLAKNAGLELLDCLMRTNQTRQIGSTRALRQKQIKGAYRTKHNQKIVGRPFLLVDDVTTTGATIEEAARVLKNAGAKSVDAIVFAQKR